MHRPEAGRAPRGGDRRDALGRGGIAAGMVRRPMQVGHFTRPEGGRAGALGRVIEHVCHSDMFAFNVRGCPSVFLHRMGQAGRTSPLASGRSAVDLDGCDRDTRTRRRTWRTSRPSATRPSSGRYRRPMREVREWRRNASGDGGDGGNGGVGMGTGLSGSLRSWYYRLVCRLGAVIEAADRPPSSAEPGGRTACPVNATCGG